MKFKLGQHVQVKQDGEVGQILGVSIDQNGIRYKVSSREVDLQRKEIINGVKTLMEDEIEAVKKKKEENEE